MRTYQKKRAKHGTATPLQDRLTGGAGLCLPAVPVIQRYSINDNGDKISNRGKWAVRAEGTPGSRFFMKAGLVPYTLNENIVRFEVTNTTDEFLPGMNEVRAVPQISQEDIKKAKCDDFSQRLTGMDRKEDIPNNTAKPGRSLYTGSLNWQVSEDDRQRGFWANHFAAVIASDKGDKATFETAARVDHASFGIYGQRLEQSFHYKTVLADIELAHREGLLLDDEYNQFKLELEEFGRTGIPKSTDKEMQTEMENISKNIGQKPDLDFTVKKRQLEKEKLEEEKKEIRDKYLPLLSSLDADQLVVEIRMDNDRKYFILSQLEGFVSQSGNKELIDKVKFCRNNI
jgi:hypothetical protein